MTHILLDAQKRIYALQIVMAALAIVLLLQIGARLDGGSAAVSGNSMYGPPQTVRTTNKVQRVNVKKKSLQQRRSERLQRRGSTGSR